MAYEINYPDDGPSEVFARLPEWARDSLGKALLEAAQDPYLLPGIPALPAELRLVEYADGREFCLVQIEEQGRRLIVRYIKQPR